MIALVLGRDCNVANPERCLIISCGTSHRLAKDFNTHKIDALFFQFNQLSQSMMTVCLLECELFPYVH